MKKKKRSLPPFYRKIEGKLAAATKSGERIFSGVVAYSPDDESQMDQYYRFATELKPGSMQDNLWKPDGTQAASILIQKEIHNSPHLGLQYPVFSVYNHLDYSKIIPDTGCRVNKKPYLKFSAALKLAERHFAAALESGKWIDVKDVK